MEDDFLWVDCGVLVFLEREFLESLGFICNSGRRAISLLCTGVLAFELITRDIECKAPSLELEVSRAFLR